MILATLLLFASTLHAGPERAVQPPPPDTQPYEQLFDDVAAGDGMALTLWVESHELRAARVDRDGKTLDATPLTIASDGTAASAAWGDDGWLVVWTGDGGILSRVVGRDGTLAAPVPVATLELGTLSSVAFDGEHYLVAWRDSTKFFGARLDADGSLPEGPFEIAAADERHIGALLPDRDGGFVLVAWLRGIDVLRLDSRGRVRSSRRVAMPVHLGHVVAGFDAAGRLVVTWRDELDVYLQRGDGAPVLLERGIDSMSADRVVRNPDGHAARREWCRRR